jgi:hypothetical protein
MEGCSGLAYPSLSTYNCLQGVMFLYTDTADCLVWRSAFARKAQQHICTPCLGCNGSKAKLGPTLINKLEKVKVMSWVSHVRRLS